MARRDTGQTKKLVFRSQKSRSEAAIDLYGPQMSMPAMWSRRNRPGATRVPLSFEKHDFCQIWTRIGSLRTVGVSTHRQYDLHECAPAGPKNLVFRSQKPRSDAAIDLYDPQMSLPAMRSRRGRPGATSALPFLKNQYFSVLGGIFARARQPGLLLRSKFRFQNKSQTSP